MDKIVFTEKEEERADFYIKRMSEEIMKIANRYGTLAYKDKDIESQQAVAIHILTLSCLTVLGNIYIGKIDEDSLEQFMTKAIPKVCKDVFNSMYEVHMESKK